MSNRFLMSAALAALIAGAGIAQAQTPAPAGGGASAPSSAPAAAGTSGERGGAAGGAMSRETAPAGREMNRAAEPKDGAKDMNRNAESKDGAKDMNRNADSKDGAKDMNRNADTKSGTTDTNRNAQTREGADKAGTTTGQAAAGAKMTTEQRTKVTTVIKQQNVTPVTNINFNISVGTRVPRDIAFRPVPTEIITIYPAWRGYEFFLARGEIIIVNPATYEIVAVLPA